MTTERISPIPRSKATVFLRKAASFGRSMDAAFSTRDFDASGLNGVHSVISACDALTVARLGLRSTAQDHSEVLKLLVRCDVPGPVLTQVRETLAAKNRVEYEARELSEEEATLIRTRAQRVLDFATRALSESNPGPLSRET
jgi:hypothetical protein